VTPGTKLGPYEILERIGGGGMGDVYKAVDTRLDRVVALKISKEAFSEMFHREARAVAALNHPHICQLYDVGPNYLVMEYVDGHLLKGPLRADEAIRYAIQIADALDSAHRKGVVHRDLKPGNVMIGKAGVKILDFGLAKIEAPKTTPLRPDALPDEIPTEEMWETQRVFGTVHYMSPEQLQHKTTDTRSDIYSFGLLLYEILTGHHAYHAKNVAELVGTMVGGPEPSLAEVSSPALDRVFHRCIRPDPDDRWQSARDLKVNLEWVALGLDQTVAAPVKTRRTSPLVWGAVILCALALGATVVLWMRPVQQQLAVKLAMLPPESASFVPGPNGGPPELSRDGRMIAFVAEQADQQMLWVRSLDSLAARALPGSEGARSPFWSPDGQSLGVFAQGRLVRISLDGGTPTALAPIPGGFASAGAWSKDNRILYAPSSLLGLLVIPTTGGQPEPVTKLETEDLGHFWPKFLPDGQRYLFSTQGDAKIYSGTLGQPGRKLILDGASHGEYSPGIGRKNGYLLFVRMNTLFAQPFDLDKLEVSGMPQSIADGVGPTDFSVSDNGTLAYRKIPTSGTDLLTFDRNGKSIGSLGKQPGPTSQLRFSPNSKTIALARTSGRTSDIWLYDLARGSSSRLTFSGGTNPVWSPDGSKVLFKKADGLYYKTADGTGDEMAVYKNASDQSLRNATDWSNDGRYLLLGRSEGKTGFDMWLLEDPMKPGEHKETPLLRSATNEGQGRFSPSPGPARWVAYSAEETGTNEIYVMSMPGMPTGKWQVSNGGGYAPRWRQDGRELFYMGPDLRTIMAVDIEPGPLFRSGAPRVLFKVPTRVDGAAIDQGFAVTPDGKAFLVAVPGQDSAPTAINVLLNWQADLTK
jgi:eukaryotic-like serine/threonine-protein kinase